MQRATRQPVPTADPATLLDVAHMGFVVVDAAGMVSSANTGAELLLLGPSAQGRPFANCLNDAEKTGLMPAGAGHRLLPLLAGTTTTLQLERLDGRTLFIQASAFPDGGTLLELCDVTTILQAAKSGHRDPLTGLANRLAFAEALEQDLARGPDASPLALLYLDLDRFKLVNDSLGHPIGDALLRRVAERIQGTLNEGDVLARLGGDEFAILLRNAEQPAAERLALTIIDLVSRAYLIQGHMINVGVSIGIALKQGAAIAADELIKRADLALFKAKSEGRGKHRFFTDDLDQNMQARRSLEIELRRALALEEFTLAYQPQFEVNGTNLVGFESLLRWNHKTRGTVSPAEFIPLAEETGLIVSLGEWVLRTACHEAASWPSPLTVSVNVSPLQFRNAKLVTTIVSALANSGLDPQRLDLEITEGALLDNTEAVVATLHQIKALGVKVSMDDFGTGYSSLSYLQKFPFDKIKIDQSFVRSMSSNNESTSIIRAIAALGASLGMTTIAEGVETPEQLALISAEGCHQVQGYYTGRPLPKDSVHALIAQL